MTSKFNRVAVIRGFTTSLLISGLRIVFKIERSPFDAVGRLQMDIYNANLSEQGETVMRLGERFILEGGYDGAVSAMFFGTVQNAAHFRQGEDRITRIWAGDFIEPFQAKLNLTFRNPKSLVDLINQMAKQVGINVVQFEISEANTVGSMTMDGTLSYELNNLAESFGFMWILKDNALHIVDKAGSNSNRFDVNAGTGMLEPPILTHQGMNIKMLLEPSIKPSDTFTVESGGLQLSQSNLEYTELIDTGNKQVQVAYTVVHTGDTHSDTWFTEVEGIAQVEQ